MEDKTTNETTSVFRDQVERRAWQYNADRLVLDVDSRPIEAAYLWQQVLDFARKKVGYTAYQGELWFSKVVAVAESVLDELGVPHERYCGMFYVAGLRVWQDRNGNWRQDTYRPETIRVEA
jgi:hypothetical protein